MAFFNSENADMAFKKYQIKYFIIILLATLANSAFCMPLQHFLLLGQRQGLF